MFWYEYQTKASKDGRVLIEPKACTFVGSSRAQPLRDGQIFIYFECGALALSEDEKYLVTGPAISLADHMVYFDGLAEGELDPCEC